MPPSLEKPNEVLVLTGIKPVEVDDGLFSPDLELQLDEHDERELWNYFLSQEEGSLEELDAAENLAGYYVLRTSREQQLTGQNKGLWADRFTEASSELYGEAEVELAKGIAGQALQELIDVPSDDEAVLESQLRIKKVLESVGSTEIINPYEIVNEERRGLLLESLQKGELKNIFEVLRRVGASPPYRSDWVRSFFGEVVGKFAQENEAWSDWEITNTPDKSMLSVIASKHKIDVPDDRRDIESREELARLTCHELGVHVQRSVNGEMVDDAWQDERMLQTGLASYADFEEGLGCFVEHLVSDEDQHKILDYYIEVALALGVLTGQKMSRSELLQFATDKELVRAYKKGDALDNELIKKKAKMNIDRVFRGGDAIQHIEKIEKEEVIKQAVFTRGVAYLNGFIKVAAYINEQMDARYSADEIWQHLLSGKFDPTIESHREYTKARDIKLRKLAA